MNAFANCTRSSLESRHLLYLQLRKSILESQILCADEDLIELGGLALQAEIGDCVSTRHRPIDVAQLELKENICIISRQITEGSCSTANTITTSTSDYFTVSHYLPEGVYQRRRDVVQLLSDAHRRRRGLHAKEAELLYVKHVQQLKEHGLHLYSAIWVG